MWIGGNGGEAAWGRNEGSGDGRRIGLRIGV
jgi:hypothetical protein